MPCSAWPASPRPPARVAPARCAGWPRRNWRWANWPTAWPATSRRWHCWWARPAPVCVRPMPTPCRPCVWAMPVRCWNWATWTKPPPRCSGWPPIRGPCPATNAPATRPCRPRWQNGAATTLRRLPPGRLPMPRWPGLSGRSTRSGACWPPSNARCWPAVAAAWQRPPPRRWPAAACRATPRPAPPRPRRWCSCRWRAAPAPMATLPPRSMRPGWPWQPPRPLASRACNGRPMVCWPTCKPMPGSARRPSSSASWRWAVCSSSAHACCRWARWPTPATWPTRRRCTGAWPSGCCRPSACPRRWR